MLYSANKNSSETTVNGCKIYETKFGIVNYIKKPYYSYPKLDVLNCAFERNIKNIYYEKNDIYTSKYD